MNGAKMKDIHPKIEPVSLNKRIASLDVLRGFAVLGILIMNIQSFAMIEAAYINPAAYGDLTGLNKWTWILSHAFGDMKFLSIFSILFGAGIYLMTSKAESKGLKPNRLHVRRMFWLLVIGLAHAYLLWHGDILVTYALCGFWVLLFRKKTPKTLLVVGLGFMAVPTVLYLFAGAFFRYIPPESIEGMMRSWKPAVEIVSREIQAYQGGWLDQMPHRALSSLAFQTFLYLMFFGWRAGGLMLVGMALFRWRVLSAERSKGFYVRMVVAGLSIGWLFIIVGVIKNFAAGWSMGYSMFIGSQFNYWGSFSVALGYIGIIMLICQSRIIEKITTTLSAVGRMAFSNYFLQTLICTTLFYGHGFGLFGRVERKVQILIVAAVWIVQLIISPLWLRHFRFGLLEWLWRTLTYGKRQPLRI